MITYTKQTSTDKLSALKDWCFENNALEKKFVFKNFQEAITFMLRVAFLCETKNHHPEWTNVYNKLTIRFNTHDAGGVTDKDFEMAEKIDQVSSV